MYLSEECPISIVPCFKVKFIKSFKVSFFFRGLCYYSIPARNISCGGAFFAGVLIAESKSHAVSRDMFAALFFVSVRALMDVSMLPLFIVPSLILIAVSLVAKFLTVFLAAKSQGFSKLTSLRAGIGLSCSGGELALVVAKGGIDAGVTSSFLLPMVGAMTIITTFISPYIIKFGSRFAESLVNKSKKAH